MNFGSTVSVSSACTWHCFPANQQMFLVRCCSYCAPILPLIPKYICLFPHMMFFPLELLTRLTELCSHVCEHWCPVAWTGSRHSVARATNAVQYSHMNCFIYSIWGACFPVWSLVGYWRKKMRLWIARGLERHKGPECPRNLLIQWVLLLGCSKCFPA